MEKFYIVTNKKFLQEIKDYENQEKQRNDFIKRFFKKKGIRGKHYYISGDGFVNVPFKENEKHRINLYILDCEGNRKLFGKQLLKGRVFDDGANMCRFHKNSTTLKEFQERCVEEQIVINSHFHREGDYFDELHLGGYSVTRFELAGVYYLRMSTSRCNSITPSYEGFNEIKGSEFYQALEEYKELHSDTED